MFFIAAAKNSSSAFLPLIYFALFGAFYFLYLRPRSKKQKEARLQARQASVGDRVQTIGGVLGVVVAQTAESVTIRTATSDIEFALSAIARRIDPVTPVQPAPELNEGDEQ